MPLFSIPGRRASCPWCLLKPLQLLINGSQLLSHFHNALLHPLDDVSRSPLNEARHLELSLVPLADEGELFTLLLEALTLLVDVRGGVADWEPNGRSRQRPDVVRRERSP